MFNLLISYNPDSWNSSPYSLNKNRVAVEYTVNEISERYRSLDQKAIEELKSFPTLFVTEDESSDSRIGYITNIRIREPDVIIDFKFDPHLPSLPIGAIEDMKIELDIGGWEMSRTHWAIKNEPLFEILINKKYITKEQLKASGFSSPKITQEPKLLKTAPGEFNKSQVFIVHGHDELTKLEMHDFIKELGLEPIILHMQANSGMTVIEKIERYSNVGFGIILYTPCDVGTKVGELKYDYRARQNVVFEHGFLIGKLGRSRVAAVLKEKRGRIETPNDISGVVYHKMDDDNAWKKSLISELRNVGFSV